eukprot:1148061-Pelagomonas_calceolata.AAC.2
MLESIGSIQSRCNMLFVTCKCELPADLILLSSSDEGNECHVETANLDGGYLLVAMSNVNSGCFFACCHEQCQQWVLLCLLPFEMSTLGACSLVAMSNVNSGCLFACCHLKCQQW